MFPSACGGSVGTTGEALLQSLDDAVPFDKQRPLRSCTSRLSRGEKHHVLLRLLMSPSACGGSVGTTGEALLQSIDDASPNDSSRPLRSCTSRLSRGEKHHVSLQHEGRNSGEFRYELESRLVTSPSTTSSSDGSKYSSSSYSSSSSSSR